MVDRGGAHPMTEADLGRLAVQIAAQLPVDPDEGIKCLQLAIKIVEQYMMARKRPEMPADNVLAFPSSCGPTPGRHFKPTPQF